jgi:hypothetical protein
MPRLSERQALIDDVESILKEMAINGDENTADFSEMMELRASLEETRYLNLRRHVRKNRSMNDMLWSYSDKDFRQAVRMDKSSFVRIVELIKNHPVFNRESKTRRQAAVWIQLMVTLQFCGLEGNGASIGRNARSNGFGEGTVVKFKQRCFTAILSMEKEYIKWPDVAERDVISSWFRVKHGIPNAVGIVDGTPAVFAQKPGNKGQTYI